MKINLLIVIFSLCLICENNAMSNHIPNNLSRAIHAWISEIAIKDGKQIGNEFRHGVFPVCGQAGMWQLKNKLYTHENIQYPQLAITTLDEGTVYVAFEINQNGELMNVHIAQGVSTALNEAALKLVVSMPLHELVADETNCSGSYVIPIKFEII